ncbi:MAG: hypothetical protein ACREJO_16995 [Phycisphaerales bacterium]
MKRIAALVVRIADLAEAEGRTLLSVARQEGTRLHGAVARLAGGIAWLLAGALLGVGGVCLVAFGTMLWLEAPLGRPAAAVITGVATLAVAGGCRWMFHHKTAH